MAKTKPRSTSDSRAMENHGSMRQLVRAVSVEDGRGRAVAGGAGPADQRDRHPGAVGRGGPLAVLLVVGRVVAAQHRPLLAQHQVAGAQVVVVDAVRGDQRRVAAAGSSRRVVLRVGVQPDGVERLGKVDVVRRRRRPADRSPVSPSRRSDDHDVAGERVDLEQPGAGRRAGSVRARRPGCRPWSRRARSPRRRRCAGSGTGPRRSGRARPRTRRPAGAARPRRARSSGGRPGWRTPRWSPCCAGR